MIALKCDAWGLNVLKDELKKLYEDYQRAAGTLAYRRTVAYRDEICRRIHAQIALDGEQLRRLGKLRVIQKAKSASGLSYYVGSHKKGVFTERTDAQPCKAENVTKTLLCTGLLGDASAYLIRVDQKRGSVQARLLPPRGRGPVFTVLYKRFWYGPSFGTNQAMRDAWAGDWAAKTQEALAKLKAATEAASKSPPAMR